MISSCRYPEQPLKGRWTPRLCSKLEHGPLYLTNTAMNTDVSSGSAELLRSSDEADGTRIADSFNDELCDVENVQAMTFTQVKTSSTLISFMNSCDIIIIIIIIIIKQGLLKWHWVQRLLGQLTRKKYKNELCSSGTELNRMFVCIRRRQIVTAYHTSLYKN